jgi:hypothetical protein
MVNEIIIDQPAELDAPVTVIDEPIIRQRDRQRDAVCSDRVRRTRAQSRRRITEQAVDEALGLIASRPA